jgi:hypothetical protein
LRLLCDRDYPKFKINDARAKHASTCVLAVEVTLQS